MDHAAETRKSVPQQSHPTQNTPTTSSFPKDAAALSLLLRAHGVSQWDAAVVPQLLEFVFRHVVDMLHDAQNFAEHAGRPSPTASSLTVDDVRLAIQQRVQSSWTAPPPREMLLNLATKRNSLPLPLVTDRAGVRLPPERHCLFGLEYQVLAPKSNKVPNDTAEAPVSSLTRLSSLASKAVAPLAPQQPDEIDGDDQYDDENDIIDFQYPKKQKIE